jgi:hypothetical protein
MSISHLLVRLLLVPLGGLLAGGTATLVAFLANWNAFLSVIGGEAMTSGDIVAAMVGLAMVLVGSAATFPMLLPATIGITISEALAVRSLVFHVLNGVVSIWVGRATMMDPGQPFEFHGQPAAVLAAGLAAGLVYWLIAGRSAGLVPDTPRVVAPGVPNPR